MLRYTTIHHDVRRRFRLTIAEYMVADSIMQQTKYQESCKQGPTEMGEWLDLTKETVIRAKKRLQNEGLIVEAGGGFITSNDFLNAIRYASGDKMSPKGDKMSPKGDKMSPAHIYINKEITSEQSSHESVEETDDGLVVEEVDDEGNPLTKLKKKGNAHIKVFECFGIPQPSWFRNTTQIKAARALLEERGLEQIQKAIAFYEASKDTPFIPEILTPYDLDTKWEKLLAFRKKRA